VMLMLLPGWIIRVLVGLWPVAAIAMWPVGDSGSMWACHMGPHARQRRLWTDAADC
jgi:hypothetical protein